REGERYFAMVKVESVNFEGPESESRKAFFDSLTPLYPCERIRMETEKEHLSGRIMDLLTPLGKGQRGLLVSPPRTGKTMLLQSIDNSITKNTHELTLIIPVTD